MVPTCPTTEVPGHIASADGPDLERIKVACRVGALPGAGDQPGRGTVGLENTQRRGQ